MEVICNLKETIVGFEYELYRRLHNLETDELTWKCYDTKTEVTNLLFNKLEQEFQKLNK